MLTTEDARTMYDELLGQLRSQGADELVRQIEVIVLRGAIRTESDTKRDDLQTPLSAQEALVVALQMFLAALEPTAQVAHAKRELGSVGDDGNELNVGWEYDRLAIPDDGEESYALMPAGGSTTYGQLAELPAIELVESESLTKALVDLATLISELEGDN